MTDRDAVESRVGFFRTQKKRRIVFDARALSIRSEEEARVPRSAEFEHVRVRCMNILKPGIAVPKNMAAP